MRTFIILIGYCALAGISFGQDTPVILYYPSEKNVNEKIQCEVTQESSGFRYTYLVSNLADAEQSIWVVRIVTPSELSPFSTPEDWDVRVTAGAQGIRRVEWNAADSIFFIRPGDAVPGFAFGSVGLPGISNYYVQGWIDLPKVDVDPDSIVGGGDVFERSKMGKTLAPIEPPCPFTALNFLDTLISYKHQAFALGWIKEEGIVTSLDAKLEAVRPQIIADRPSAKNILQSFINEMDALNTQGNQITSEAYALLKFNAQYLMSKL